MDTKNSDEEKINRQNDTEKYKEDDKTTDSCSDVKSSAVVKYDVIKSPAKFAKLQSNTDLKLPPANWLRRDVCSDDRWIQGLKGHWAFPGSSPSTDTVFTSFHMANNFPDCVGDVDVVSDAENIKRLLKIPYSNGTVSMMVHRIGKTLLLDQFDIHSHLLRTSETDWAWIRKFYYEQILQSLQEKSNVMSKSNKSRDHLLDKSMFSKFLYYSIADMQNAANEEANNEFSERVDEDGKCEKTIDADENYGCRDKSANNGHEVDEENLPAPLTSFHESLLNVEEEEVQHNRHEHQRNVIWTFEDIQMLIGSDMPIFGGGTHPAVSLRLRDMAKPITVLTGLDYWLDNLMCNVPEVLMCYHLNGIVQEYELLKTEEIPNLENSKFSPKLVNDVAQNILSFLKSNATKSGHTYWLFKGKSDDVVKLYDLTILCSDVAEDPEQNPYTIPVAMLLFKVAKKIHGGLPNNKSDSSSSNLSYKKKATLYTLLKDCLNLLDSSKYHKVVAAVHYLLADLYAPNNRDKLKSCDKSANENVPNNSESSSDESDDCEITFESSPSVKVETLYNSHYYPRQKKDKRLVLPSIIAENNLEECCVKSLHHIAEGIQCLINMKNNVENMDDQKEELVNPDEPIPLHEPSVSNKCNATVNNLSIVKRSRHIKKFGLNVMEDQLHIVLLERAAHCNFLLANIAHYNGEYGKALKYIQHSYVCSELIQDLVERNCGVKTRLSYTSNVSSSHYRRLCLCGDIFAMFVSKDVCLSNQLEAFKNQSCDDELITESDVTLDHLSYYAWLFEISENHSTEDILKMSVRAYNQARRVKEIDSADRDEFYKKLSSVKNLLGLNYMNQALKIRERRQMALRLCEDSMSILKESIEDLEKLNDKLTIASVYANLARLMRLFVHVHTPESSSSSSSSKRTTEFTPGEDKYYKKCVKFYQQSLKSLETCSSNENLWNSVSWDLSTAECNYATLLQDCFPHSWCSQEEVENKVDYLFSDALKNCEQVGDSTASNQFLCEVRASIIHHRLASLHHNAYRNLAQSDYRRKAKKAIAEKHYAACSELFFKTEDYAGYIRCVLEHVGLLEHYFKGLTGIANKVTTLKSMLEVILNVSKINGKIILGSDDSDDEGENGFDFVENEFQTDDPTKEDDKKTNKTKEFRKKEFEKYMEYLKNQLSFTLHNIINILMRSQKHNEANYINVYKTMYAEFLKQTHEIKSYMKLLIVLTKLNELYESRFQK